jgi:hypothetical protein
MGLDRSLIDRAVAAADSVWSEPVTIQPYRAATARNLGGSDPSRPAFVTEGVVVTKSRAPRKGIDWATDFDIDDALLYVDHTKMPPYPVIEGDYIQTPGPRQWRVSTVRTEATDRVEITLIPIRGVE